MLSARRPSWRILLPIIVLLASSLACGGFQVRVTPTPAPPTPEQLETPESTPIPEPSVMSPTETPGGQPTAAPTLTPAPPTPAPVARQARVAASGGLNVRDTASAKGKQLGRLAGNATVTIIEGPVDAENYQWYKVDNGSGLVGWAAAGPRDDPWLVPIEAAAAATPTPASTGKLVDRAIKSGDTVQVTTDANQILTVRADPGRGANPVARVPRGTRFTVTGGPVQQDNLTWWQLEGDAVKGWAAEGDGTSRWLTPVEP